MRTNINDPMLSTVQPGQPGWFYVREPREETLRRLVRTPDGDLWIASGPLPIRLDNAEIEVLGPVPALGSVSPEDQRTAELTAEIMVLREQVRAMKACLAALCTEEGTP